eukprot:COSAG05_NODE_1208_length_5523_cov_14.095686_3_plen_158_part_00
MRSAPVYTQGGYTSTEWRITATNSRVTISTTTQVTQVIVLWMLAAAANVEGVSFYYQQADGGGGMTVKGKGALRPLSYEARRAFAQVRTMRTGKKKKVAGENLSAALSSAIAQVARIHSTSTSFVHTSLSDPGPSHYFSVKSCVLHVSTAASSRSCK